MSANSYFLWCPGAFVVQCLLWLTGEVDFLFLAGCNALYLLQLLLYCPQFGRGWSPWLLYSRVTDHVLGYYDGTCVREGKPPESLNL